MRPNKRFLKNTLLGAARQRDAEKKKHHSEVNQSGSRGSSQNKNTTSHDNIKWRRKEREGEKSHQHHRHEPFKRQSSSENDRNNYLKKKKTRTSDKT